MTVMARWLSVLVLSGLVSLAGTSADAQVFKPKGKKSDAAERKSAKKPAKKKAGKKKVTRKARKNTVAERDSSDDDAPEPRSKRSKNADPDYVKITDDDDIE